MAAEPIVSAEWLKDALDKDSNICVLDVTWASDKDMKEAYLKEHIPGAVYFGIFEGVNNTPTFQRNIADVETFQKNARAAGVNEDSHVVVYDTTQLSGNGFFIGSRAWWIFKLNGAQNVSVLDGGMNKWKEAGYPTTAEASSVKEGNFVAKRNESLIRTHDEMKENLEKKNFVVGDSRPTEGYGNGHVPGAINVPFAAKLLNKEKGTFKTPGELKRALTESGVCLDKPLVTMCNSGMSSCSLLLAATVLGKTDVSLYLGGFTEWKSKSDGSDIEK